MPNNQKTWTLKPVFTSNDYSIGSWGDIFFTVFRANNSLEITTRIIKEVSFFCSTRPSGIGLYTIINQRATFPGENERKYMSKMLGELNVILSGTVLEGRGFRAAAVRGIIASLSMTTRHNYPQKVFSTIKDCSSWFSKIAKEKANSWHLDPDSLSKAVEEFIRSTEVPM